MKRTLILLLASAFLASGLTACDNDAQAEADVELHPWVEAGPVQRGTVDRSLVLTGTIQAGRTVHLLPMAAAKIESLPVKVGDRVSKGQVLARLDTDLSRLQFQQAEAAVGLAEVGLATAEREFERAQKLHQTGTLTDQQFEQAKAGMDMANLQLAQAKAAKGLANEQLVDGVVKAPFDGLVASVGGEVGNWFSPAAMNPMAPGGLVSVVDLSSVKVDVQVTDRDVSLIEPGMPAVLEVDALGERLPEGLPGTVESVGFSADAASRTFPVRVVASNPDTVVRAGMHARVRLVLERSTDALWVPEDAIQPAAVGQYVLVLQEDSTAQMQPVKTGIHGDRGIEILSGLDGSEQIVVKGAFGVKPGAVVEVAR